MTKQGKKTGNFAKRDVNAWRDLILDLFFFAMTGAAIVILLKEDGISKGVQIGLIWLLMNSPVFNAKGILKGTWKGE